MVQNLLSALMLFPTQLAKVCFMNSSRFRRQTAWLAVILALFGSPEPARAQETPSSTPVLALNTGGHLATITNVAFTSDGRRLVSAGKDKTIRTWSVSSGKQATAIRGQIGPNREGQIYALAIPPDDSSVSVGGWFGATGAFQPCCGDIRQFDLNSGKLRTVLKGHTGPVSALSHSGSSGELLSGSSNGEVFLWPRRDRNPEAKGVQVAKDPVRLADGMAAILKVGWLQNDQLAVAVARNGEVAFIDLATRKTVRSVMTTSGQLVAADVGQHSEIVVVADQFGVVSTWSPGSGDALASFDAGNFYPGTLTLSDADKKVLVGCGYNCAGVYDLVLWDIAKAETVGRYSAHDDTVWASALSPDGVSFVTAGGERHELHLWRPGLIEPEHRMSGVAAPVWAVDYIPETRDISWGTEDPCPFETYCPTRQRSLGYRFRLPQPGEWMDDPTPIGADSVDTTEPVAASGAWSLGAKRGGNYNLEGAVLEIRHSGDRRSALERDTSTGTLHMSFTISEDRETFFTAGLRGEIDQYQLDGARLTTKFKGGHFDTVLAVGDTLDENLLLTGGADQRLALWNRTTGELIANMIYAEDGNWIIWVPQGYYYSSPDGDNLVGWHINQGNDREARYLTARQLRRHLFSPEIIRRALELKSARLAIEELRPNDTRLAELLARPAPAFALDLVKNDPSVPKGYARVRIKWDSSDGRAEEEVRLFTNNRHIETTTARSMPSMSELESYFDVKLTPGENNIKVSISNKYGYVTERGAFDILTESTDQPRNGRLFVVVVGVNDYPELLNTCSGPGGSCDLKYAVKDARVFLDTVNTKVGARFLETTPLILVNGGELEPTADNIQDEIEEFLEEPTEEDMTLIFFAGHGVNIKENYYFVPTDGEKRSSDKWRTRSLVEWTFLRSSLEETKGTRILFLDTCHSGNAYNARLVKDTADARVVVFSGAKSNQYALETSDKKHGLFTYSLVNGLNGEADYSKDQAIRLLELATYVSDSMGKLSDNRQTPEFYLSGLEDFLLAKW